VCGPSSPSSARSARLKALSSGVADYVLDPSSQDVKEEVLKLTDGIGADIGFECAGVNEELNLLLDAVRPAGVIVNVSIWGQPATVDMQKLVLKEIDLRGTIAYVRDHKAVIKLVQAGKIDLKPFITGRAALDDLVSENLRTLIVHNDTAVKILVHP
jgi:(R,R)-butanediol dehydrogenase/meso-butanediol dehydrogenase/diacetyl reductase